MIYDTRGVLQLINLSFFSLFSQNCDNSEQKKERKKSICIQDGRNRQRSWARRRSCEHHRDRRLLLEISMAVKGKEWGKKGTVVGVVAVAAVGVLLGADVVHVVD